MVSTEINGGDLYITDGVINTDNTITTSGSQLVVRITPTTKLDYTYDNNIIFFPIPISKQDRGDEPFSRVIDLKRIKESITAAGFLADEISSSAEKKRDDLLVLAKKGGDLSIVWGRTYITNNYQTIWKRNASASEFGVFVLKMTFTTTPGKIGQDIAGATDQEPSERNIAIIITLVRGKDM